MAEPIKGHEGTVKANGVLTGFVSTWEVSLESEEKTVGPFIGDETIYTYTTSRRLTGSIEAMVPRGRDSGQTTLLSGALSGGTVALELVTTEGYTITVPSGSVSTFTMAQDAAENITLNFDFSSSGTFTVLPSA